LLVVRDVHIGKVVLESFFALDASVFDLAYLFAVEALPLLRVELQEKVNYVHRVGKIDEGVSDVALVLEIDRQVEEIIFVLVSSVKLFQKHSLRVLVWNVSNHNCCSRILVVNYLVQIEIKSELLLTLVRVVAFVAIAALVWVILS
jgi:hypothetical protein